MKSEVLYYNEKWSESGVSNAEQLRIDQIFRELNKLDLSKDLNILEIGCGKGNLARLLRAFGRVMAIDLAEVENWNTFANIEFYSGDFLEHTFTEKYDLIVSSEVIEHVHDQEGFIKKIYLLLNHDGHAILTTPNWDCSYKVLTPENSQPFENHMRFDELGNMVEKYFEIQSHYGFRSYYRDHGILYRVLKKFRLLRLVFVPYILPVIKKIFRSPRYNIYQIISFEKELRK